ncbi:hypothetical protein F4809DRAFT_444990 [Biscogniauxia mediterranea]|nr:hypothetical protein F4809DRAFT_444990 [Biscogniauxia mediterranea]
MFSQVLPSSLADFISKLQCQRIINTSPNSIFHVRSFVHAASTFPSPVAPSSSLGLLLLLLLLLLLPPLVIGYNLQGLTLILLVGCCQHTWRQDETRQDQTRRGGHGVRHGLQSLSCRQPAWLGRGGKG